MRRLYFAKVEPYLIYANANGTDNSKVTQIYGATLFLVFICPVSCYSFKRTAF